MMQELYNDNGIIIEHLNEAFAAAEEENQQGIANFIAERLDAHGKHGWQLRSILKRQRA
jgi:DNA-binding ferritin-like protein